MSPLLKVKGITPTLPFTNIKNIRHILDSIACDVADSMNQLKNEEYNTLIDKSLWKMLQMTAQTICPPNVPGTCTEQIIFVSILSLSALEKVLVKVMPHYSFEKPLALCTISAGEKASSHVPTTLVITIKMVIVPE